MKNRNCPNKDMCRDYNASRCGGCTIGEKITRIVRQNKKLKAENAELRARLEKAVELPCKVGDTIYQTDTNGTRIFKSTVKNIIFETDGVAFDERAIGESIFLTEEAVKEKMKKLQEKNNDRKREDGADNSRIYVSTRKSP